VRLIFFILLIANVAFFAWRESAAPLEHREPQRLQEQIDPDKLKLVAADAPVTEPAEPKTNTTDTAPALLCKSFSGLSPDAAKAAQTAIGSNAQVAITPTKQISWWVMIPPQPNQAGAEKKTGELRQMGVKDSIIISAEGSTQWAISLGVFATQEAAETHLKKINTQGVRSARIQMRSKSDGKMRVEINAPAETIDELAHSVKPLATAILGECEKPATPQ
jgi:hypothetical protein